jgi:hypothetical protein
MRDPWPARWISRQPPPPRASASRHRRRPVPEMRREIPPQNRRVELRPGGMTAMVRGPCLAPEHEGVQCQKPIERSSRGIAGVERLGPGLTMAERKRIWHRR